MAVTQDAGDRPGSLTWGARIAVIVGGLLATPLVFDGLYVGVGSLDPPLVHTVGAGILIAAVAAVVLFWRRGPRDRYARAVVLALMVLVLVTTYLAVALSVMFSSDVWRDF